MAKSRITWPIIKHKRSFKKVFFGVKSSFFKTCHERWQVFYLSSSSDCYNAVYRGLRGLKSQAVFV